MPNKFYSFWFMGFNNSLEKLDDKAANTVLRECGKACSESYTKNIYISEYAASSSLEEFLERLKSRFHEMQVEKISDNHNDIIYTYCGCNLVKDKFISSPKFCQCSLHSLQTNWDATIGKGNTKITMLSSVLAGDNVCKFRIEIL